MNKTFPFSNLSESWFWKVPMNETFPFSNLSESWFWKAPMNKTFPFSNLSESWFWKAPASRRGHSGGLPPPWTHCISLSWVYLKNIGMRLSFFLSNSWVNLISEDKIKMVVYQGRLPFQHCIRILPWKPLQMSGVHFSFLILTHSCSWLLTD